MHVRFLVKSTIVSFGALRVKAHWLNFHNVLHNLLARLRL